MKMLKSIMLGIAMVAVCGMANAKATKGTDEPLTENYVVSTYVSAITQGSLKDFTRILDNDVTFSATQNNEVKSFQKDDVIANLKANEGIKQECTTTTSKVKETPDGTVYQVDMKYADHTRTDMVTIVEGSNGWKITDVSSLYK